MGLSLVVGPAHAGKVAALLDRFVAAIDHDPWLIVPNRGDVERVERELVRREGGLLAGTIGTFDSLFQALARGDGLGRRLVGEAERAVVVRRVVDAGPDAPGARFPGYADALGRALAELDGALLDADDLDEPLSWFVSAYRDELDRLDAWDRGMLRRRGIERLTGDLGSWGDSPVLAHGFEDLTGAEWRLLEALSARTDVHVSLPYEPGRAVYASLARTARDLSALAGDDIVDLPPRAAEYLPTPLAHVERELFAPTSERAPLDGAIRFLEGAGTRGTLELVAEEALGAIRSGIPPDEIAVVCPSLDAIRVPLETAFAALGVPLAFEGRSALRATPFGHALVSLLRFAWLGGERPELYAHLRSPYSGLQRREVDWVEGKLRGRGVVRGDRTVEVTAELRGGRPLLLLDRALADDSPVESVRAVGASMLRNAHGVVAPPLGARSRSDLAAHDAVSRTLDELDALARAGWDIGRRDVLAALDRASVPGERAGAPGPVAVIDLLRARTRRFDTVFVLGLEQGTLPRRTRVEPFLDEDSRRSLEDRRGARLERPDPASRDRYLFATACTRPRRRLFWCARPSATRAPRASRARSGRQCASSSTRTTSAARPSAGRSLR